METATLILGHAAADDDDTKRPLPPKLWLVAMMTTTMSI